MSELSVRETAARALYEEQPGHRQGWKRAWDRATETDLVFWRAEADAALAAVADHDGLADVLLSHDAVVETCCIAACRCGWTTRPDHYPTRRDHAAHLADVVRAWIRGQG